MVPLRDQDGHIPQGSSSRPGTETEQAPGDGPGAVVDADEGTDPVRHRDKAGFGGASQVGGREGGYLASELERVRVVKALEI